MSDDKHIFTLQSTWTGNSEGSGTIVGEGRTLEYGIPANLGGKAGRTSPEELLMSAVASCYSITLAILAERKRLAVTQIVLAVEGEVIRQPGGTLKFTKIKLAPKIYLLGSDEGQIKSITDAAHKAEQYCVISNAIRGNVEITVEPQVVSE
jgi:peroxiredoxin-like protein